MASQICLGNTSSNVHTGTDDAFVAVPASKSGGEEDISGLARCIRHGALILLGLLSALLVLASTTFYFRPFLSDWWGIDECGCCSTPCCKTHLVIRVIPPDTLKDEGTLRRRHDSSSAIRNHPR